MLIVLGGLPGVGKSAIARETARVLPFDNLEQPGEGGMGVVCRARAT